MKFLLKFIVYILAFFIFLFVFLPKENIYFKGEELLEKQGVVISDELLQESLYALKISGADVYFKGVYFANINKLDVSSFLFFTKIELNSLRFAPAISKMAPTPISNISVTHSILDPLKAKIEGFSEYGNIDGYIDFIEKKIFINFDANSKMKSNYSNVLRMMKQKDGRYTYEYNY